MAYTASVGYGYTPTGVPLTVLAGTLLGLTFPLVCQVGIAPNEHAGRNLSFIYLANIAGSLLAGWVSSLMQKRFVLAAIYLGRSIAIAAFVLLPPSPAATLISSAVIGLLWLSTVPPTSGLVAVMFGTRWLAMLFGFAFFSHQVGGFLGVWLGGVVFEATGSYAVVWWLSIFFGVASAVINLPIVEKPVVRHVPAPAPA